jgi:uncharacterized protein (DUF111 family)
VDVEFGGKPFASAVKIAQDRSGDILHISAEYEDCRRIADATGVPLRQIMRQVEEEAWRRFESKGE